MHGFESRIYQEMRELIEELIIPTQTNPEEPSETPGPPDSGLAIVPFVREGDEVVGRILARLLEAEGINSNLLSWRTLHGEKIQRLKELEARYVVLSAIESRSVIAVGKMTRSIQTLLPDAVIVVGLWSLPPTGAARLIRKIRESGVGGIYTNLDHAVRGIALLASPTPQEPHSGPVPE